jgi:hypothetical protein
MLRDWSWKQARDPAWRRLEISVDSRRLGYLQQARILVLKNQDDKLLVFLYEGGSVCRRWLGEQCGARGGALLEATNHPASGFIHSTATTIVWDMIWLLMSEAISCVVDMAIGGYRLLPSTRPRTIAGMAWPVSTCLLQRHPIIGYRRAG